MNKLSDSCQMAEYNDTENNKIIYEGFFSIDKGLQIESELIDIRNVYHINSCPIQVPPSFYHVTTEFMPESLHEQWYGNTADVVVSGYISDDQVKNPRADDISQAEGFQVESIRTESEELNSYLNQIVKKMHITTSYSRAAFDTNFADWSKGYPCHFCVRMIFGGFDVEKQKIVIS